MHFVFPGRMELIDLPYETLRVARLLAGHGFDSLWGARLRVEPLAGNGTFVLEDEFGDLLELVEVPPLQLCLSPKRSPEDAFELQRFVIRSRLETKLTGPFEQLTGPDRGPATIARMVHARPHRSRRQFRQAGKVFVEKMK